MIPDAPDEEVEHIPWSQLLAEQRAASRSWLGYVAAGAVVALAVGMVAARTLSDPRSPTPSPETAVAEATSDGTATTVQDANRQEDDGEGETRLLSEADLMAVVPGPAAEAVVGRAEWFVTDYFTTDGDGDRSGDLAAALGVRPPEPSGPPTYVEWARAVEVQPRPGGRYRITVAFRTITAADGAFRRQPVRAVEIEVAAGEGGTQVADIPSPAELPSPAAAAAWPAPQPPPAPVAERALARAAAWGEAELVEAAPVGDRWRVVVMVEDAAGAAWPVAVWVDEE